ncbi:MAG: diguanylate cyclase, partial [Rhodospirillaceae bacterium]
LLPDLGAEAALAMADRLREAVSNLGIIHAKSVAADHVTISLGVATLVPDGDDLPNRLIDQADRGLYYAKQNGRNQIGVV